MLGELQPSSLLRHDFENNVVKKFFFLAIKILIL